VSNTTGQCARLARVYSVRHCDGGKPCYNMCISTLYVIETTPSIRIRWGADWMEGRRSRVPQTSDSHIVKYERSTVKGSPVGSLCQTTLGKNCAISVVSEV
jgi:hypothetical protein